jgi:hypothetical protein
VRVFARLRKAIPVPSDDELRALALTASAEPRVAERPRRRTRWLGLSVAVGLALATAIGFGLGSWLAPSGTARPEAAGLGFLPGRGWTVLQSGPLGPATESRAVAANVPLDPADDLGGVPIATLDRLSPRGVVIFATFTPRGDPGQDFAFPLRDLPLRIEEAEIAGDPLPVARELAHYRVRASVAGTNVAAEIYLGSDALLATAQRQLNRLAVASDRVTIFVRRPASRQSANWTLFGSVESRREGEAITIQARDCGLPSFRGVAGATTVAGGGWSTTYWPKISTQVRAIWKDATSRPAEIRVPASVYVRKRSGGRLEVSAGGAKSFWRKRVRIERFDRRLGRWRPVRTLTLTESYQAGGTPPVGTSASYATFRPRLPKGTLLRAVVPLSEARPCYTAGVSPTVRL